MSVRPFVQFWLWISALATLAGWTLSAVGELNRVGYIVAFALFAGFIVLQRHSFGFSNEKLLLAMRKARRRFCRALPFCFFALAVLIFAGGVMYLPDNYTGITYRDGRILQWLSHQHWLWIHTADYRMNDRACGMEWLSAPILLFTKSTRGLFLLNFLPFLLLPGLVFSIFIQLGVCGRVAWHWMWLLPTGYTFLLQAGGNANDTFPTVYALAAVYYALRASSSRAGDNVTSPAVIGDLWRSILAAALLTGAKASNLPLLLPWAIAAMPSIFLLRKRIAGTTAVVILAAAVSFLPTAILNLHYLHDWSGASIEPAGMTVKDPFVGVWGNTFLLLLDNFAPPLFPFAGWWNAHAFAIVPHFVTTPMLHNFYSGFLWLGELPTEDWAGLGFGLSVLLAVSVIASFCKTQSSFGAASMPSRADFTRKLVLLAPWVALLAYCAKAGMIAPDRLIAPYYPLLLPLLLTGRRQSEIVRQRWWRMAAGAVIFLALIVLVISPDRPLWPAQTLLGRLAARYPENHLVSRAQEVYAIYVKRSDPLANVRALLPQDVKVVGFIAGEDDCDISFWIPFGSRRVEHFLLKDPPDQLRKKGVKYVVVNGATVLPGGVTVADWMKKTGAEVIGETNDTLKVSEGEQTWMVVRIN